MREKSSWRLADADELAERQADSKRPRGRRLLVSAATHVTMVGPLLACNPKGGPYPDPDTTESSSGDGDGDPATGDGDGDATGDGDGDMSGDGDGDMSGDGDGDGDMSGDGDGDMTGDGDGDGGLVTKPTKRPIAAGPQP